MSIRSVLVFSALCGFLISCGNGNASKNELFSLKVSHKSGKIQENEELTLSIKNKIHKNIDSVQYFYAGKILKSSIKNKPVGVKLKTPLGRRELTAKIYGKAGTQTASKNIVLHTDKSPTLYTYKIVNTYPHDPHAFTQGLEFYNDTLYEGTGLHGVSSLRKVDLKTGKVLKKITLDRVYFGEGISIMNGKIFQLTWQIGDGFVYDVNTFKKLKTFHYDKSIEGWGLCNDGKVLYKSDGTNKIWILNPETLKEERYIEPVTNRGLATKVNEMEWVNGKIYANTWQKDGVLIINPKSGAVEGVIDFRGLKDKLTNTKKANVLNGIAYNKKTDKLYVTGKNWDKLFEVKIMKK